MQVAEGSTFSRMKSGIFKFSTTITETSILVYVVFENQIAAQTQRELHDLLQAHVNTVSDAAAPLYEDLTAW